VAGGRTAAVVSGAFCLSSNRGGVDETDLAWGGAAWITEPEEGEVLALTTEEEPFATVDIDLNVAKQAKATYPRYVLE
jgi:N-carbamoylputrescine amidase